MKKKLLLLLFMFGGFSQMAFCDESTLSTVPLTCSYDDPGTFKGGIKRIPARGLNAYISGNTLSFPAFESDCNVEVFDVETGDFVFGMYVPASATSIKLPSLLKGNFYIRFIFEHYTLEGYVEL